MGFCRFCPLLCLTDRKETKFQQQFAEIEEYAMSKAGKPVNTGAGDTGSALFVPVILRCAPFYQNMYSSLRAIEQGTLMLPLGDHKYLPHVDVEDVAAVGRHLPLNPAPHHLIAPWDSHRPISSSPHGSVSAPHPIAMKLT